MTTQALRRIATLLVLLAVPAISNAADPSAVEEVLDEIGLFKSAIDPDALDRGDGGLEDPSPDSLDDDDDPDTDGERRGEPFVAPIPFRSPTLGWGGALAGGYIFRIDKEDRDSPPSTVSLAGFGSSNESFGGVVTGRLHLSEDLWRVTSTFVVAQINYDFFGVGSDAGDRGNKFEVEADVIVGELEVLRRLPNAVQVLGVPLYLGPNISANRTENDVNVDLPGVPSSEIDETRIAYGIHLQRDSRDDNFYPMSGTLSDFDFAFLDDDLGSDSSYRVWELSYRRYDELWSEGVLASRAFGRFTDGDVPFTDLSQHDLRGYERGRYRDRMHLAGELELRQHLFWRFGGAVFAGLGQVAPSVGGFDSDKLLWSAGLGLRFRLTEENRMNYRADAARGRDGFEFYFSITEAF
jgi:hypothetical protein